MVQHCMCSFDLGQLPHFLPRVKQLHIEPNAHLVLLALNSGRPQPKVKCSRLPDLQHLQHEFCEFRVFPPHSVDTTPHMRSDGS
jgi:hypothetical protein